MDTNQGIHGTLWTKVHRTLELITEYRARKQNLDKAPSTFAVPRGSTKTVDLAYGVGISNIVSCDDPDVKRLLRDHETYAERCLLLIGIYTRTIFEQLPVKGRLNIPLRDNDLQPVREQHIDLKTLSNILAHHRSLLFSGEILRDLFSDDRTLWMPTPDNAMGWSVLFQDYLDRVFKILQSIQLSDLTGLIGRWMSRLSRLQDHEIVNLVQELYCLGNLLSDHCRESNDSQFFNLWLEEDMNGLAHEVMSTRSSIDPSVCSPQNLRAEFCFPRFMFEPELAKSQIKIQGQLRLTVIDSISRHSREHTGEARKSVPFSPFLKSTANNWGQSRLVDLRT